MACWCLLEMNLNWSKCQHKFGILGLGPGAYTLKCLCSSCGVTKDEHPLGELLCKHESGENTYFKYETLLSSAFQIKFSYFYFWKFPLSWIFLNRIPGNIKTRQVVFVHILNSHNRNKYHYFCGGGRQINKLDKNLYSYD